MRRTLQTQGDHAEPTGQEIRLALTCLHMLLPDALAAGKFLQSGQAWEAHAGGTVLHFVEHAAGEQRTGRLVFAERVTPALVTESLDSRYRSTLVLGGWLVEAVDLGLARSRRLRDMEGAAQYWAIYVLDRTVLVAAGAPSSPCRLIGEIINLQMRSPFVQRRICAHCHALNTYHHTRCAQCERPLAATGTVNRT